MYDTLVTEMDYLQETGTDLNAELNSIVNYDGVGSPAPLFIYQIENWCKEYLEEHYSFYDVPSNPKSLKMFKKGVIYQIEYVIANGSLNANSGYSSENNTIIPKAELRKIALSDDALRCFRLGGMANIRRGELC